jgi:hypothetical protein
MLKLTAQSSGTVGCWMCNVAMIDKPVCLVQGSAMIDGPYQQPERQPHAHPQPQRLPSDHHPEFRTTLKAPELWRSREMLPMAGIERAQQDVSLTNVCKLLTHPVLHRVHRSFPT